MGAGGGTDGSRCTLARQPQQSTTSCVRSTTSSPMSGTPPGQQLYKRGNLTRRTQPFRPVRAGSPIQHPYASPAAPWQCLPHPQDSTRGGSCA